MAKNKAPREAVTSEESSAFFTGMRESDMPESTSLVVPNDQATQNVALLRDSLGNFTGSEGLTMSDLVVPRYKIIQPTSRVGNQGNFLKMLTEEEVPAVDAIVIRNQKGRALWEKGNFEAPICRSHDFTHPDPRIETPQNAICCLPDGTQVCPLGKWEGRKPPACKENYNLLCVDREEMMPFWLTLHGTSIEPVKRLNTTAMMRGKGRFYIFNVTFSLKLMVNEDGKFYVLVISPPVSRYAKDGHTPLDPSSEEEFMDMISMCAKASLQRTYEAEEEARGGGETNAGPEAGSPVDREVEGAPDWVNQQG